MEISEQIAVAIEQGIRAGKLRTFVRKNGDGLSGLVELANRHSALGKAALDEFVGESAELERAPSPTGRTGGDGR